MIFKRFYDEKLAQASYLIGCAVTKEAAVIDANRNLDQYLQAADEEGFNIVAVTETHIHADYVSGSRELAARTNARLFLSDEGDADWKYAFAHEPNVTLIRDNDTIRIGNLRLDVWATPGHTPEHLSFILTDEPASAEPLGAFTGDFVFVGDVGRPDLLERAAGFEGTMEAAARKLFHSIQRFKTLPDALMVWPAHGAGSACGKSLGGVPVSTLGYEKVANWALRVEDESSFATQVLAGQPEPPFYFKEMKRMNKMGPAFLSELPRFVRIAGSAAAQMPAGTRILDLRPVESFSAGHIPGSLHIPMGKGFPTWAGWFTPYDEPFYVLAANEADAQQAARDLASIGLDNLAGWFGLDALRAHGSPLSTLDRVSPSEAAQRVQSGKAELLDVRGATEVAERSLAGSRNIPVGFLLRDCDIDVDRPLVVHCAAGARAAIAASVLQRVGHEKVSCVAGTVDDLAVAGLPDKG